MTTTEDLTPAEISRRITTGMGLVYDLFLEVNGLLRLLAQGLENSEADIRPLTLRGTVLPRNKKTKSIVDWFLKLDVGLLATVGAGDSNETDETDDDASDEGSDADQEEKADKAVTKVGPETRYLGVRVILFDPLAKDPAKFQPVLVAGLIGSIQRPAKGSKRKAGDTQPETTFTLRRAAIKQLVKQLTADAKAGQAIKARSYGGAVHATLVQALVVPLAEIATEDKVNQLVDQVTALVGD
jgi:hypothetical protein